MVSEDGKYVVTFDNWHSMGYGLDVMVVYNEKGELLKRYKLEDFSPFPINTYLLTISSIHWRCGVSFIARDTVRICFQDEEEQKKFKLYNLSRLEFEKNAP